MPGHHSHRKGKPSKLGCERVKTNEALEGRRKEAEKPRSDSSTEIETLVCRFYDENSEEPRYVAIHRVKSVGQHTQLHLNVAAPS